MAATTKYWEDFHVGDTFAIPAKTLTDAHFRCFAELTGDQHPIHYDDEYAKTTRFGKRVAHGLLLTALTAVGASPLSSVGAASLIFLMVLMLYPVLPPEPQQAHAATRLGLRVTQEELNIWRQRMNDNSNGIGGLTYASIYQNPIKAEADNFRNQSYARGDGYWAGPTTLAADGCIPGYDGQNGASAPPGNGIWLLKSAFVFLLTGDRSYADPVRTELLN